MTPLYRYFFLLCTFLAASVAVAQPTKCFEITSIFVNACGSPEGENEMVTFDVGPNNLNTSNFSVTWPNNPNRGLCQNSTTASIVSTLNATIKSCGFLKEPTSGVLPAKSKVLIVTSTDMDPSFNSFANLSDTLYIIFQCVGNTNGHFANSGTGTRTLIMGFGSGCADTATYSLSGLTNTDGATVNFTYAGVGTPSYNGCNAPYKPQTVTIQTPNDTAVCNKKSFKLRAFGTNVTSFKWTGGTGTFTNDTLANTTYTLGANDTTDFKLVLSGKASCGFTRDTVNIKVQPIMKISLAADTIYGCVGQSVNMGATVINQGGIQWGGAQNFRLSSTTIANPSLTFIEADTAAFFTLTIFANNTCDALNRNVVLRATSVAKANAGPDQQVCKGKSVSLTGTANGSNITWSTTAAGTFSSTTSLNTTFTPAATQTAPFNIILLNNTACDDITDTVLITPIGDAVMPTPGATFNVCFGATLNLSAKGADKTYRIWRGKSGTFSDTISDNVTYTLGAADTSTFVIQALNINPCDTAYADFIVNPFKAPVVNAGPDQTLCGEGAITLSGTSNISTATWTTNGLGSFANSNSLNTTFTPSASQTAPFNVFLTSANGCGTDVDTLLINLGLSPTISATDSLTGCLGDTIFITGVSTTLSTGSFWQGGSGTFNNPTALNTFYLPGPADTTNLTFRLSAYNNCDTTQRIFIATINRGPTVAAGSEQVVCAQTPISLNASATNATTVQWSGGLGTFSPSTGASVTYTPAANEQGSRYLRVLASNTCGLALDSVLITFRPKAFVNILTPDTLACPNSQVPIRSTGFSDQFTWETNGTGFLSTTGDFNAFYTFAPGESKVVVRMRGLDQCGDVEDSVVLTVKPSPTLTIPNKTITACKRDTVGLVANVLNGTATFSIISGFGNLTTTGPTSATYVAATSDPNPVQILITVKDTCITLQDTFTINYLSQTPLTLFAPTNVCPGQAFFVTLSPSRQNIKLEGNYRAFTVINDSLISIIPTNTTLAQQFVVSGDGTCETDTAIFNVNFYQPIIANFDYEPTGRITILDTLRFFNRSTTNTASVLWKFGKQDSSTAINPRYRFQTPGRKSVTLFATSFDGCIDSFTQVVDVAIDYQLYIPNAFSPNGDNTNDSWGIFGTGVSTYKLLVFNRWGEILHESNNLDTRWDGTYKGATVQEGVYGYFIEVRWVDGNRSYFKGNLHILR